MLARDDLGDAITYVNELLKTSDKPSANPNDLFLTLENQGDPNPHTPIQSHILREIKEVHEIQTLNPNNSPEEQETFFRNLKWDDSQLNNEDKKDIEEVLK